MSDLQKAVEMALEALDLVMSHGQSVQRAKDVLRQALAQPKQTPVAYVSDDGASAAIVYGIELDRLTPLYTTPPKHEWVGLTVNEVLELLPSSEWKADVTLIFAKAIEAKLKEKNT